MYIKLREKKAFTLVEIMIVVAIIGLLVAIAVPNFIKARRSTRTNLCMNNLRIIDHAKEQWALDEGAGDGATVVDAELAEYFKGSDPSRIYCPLSGPDGDLNGYTVGAVGTDPACGNWDVDTHPAAL